ncbi:hypothetical protein [Novosphingobium sp.]|uniref:hypothetical protein n=1 Tax=Novosphingobium sp. TaxID=1874826 RepID=UPI0035B0313E
MKLAKFAAIAGLALTGIAVPVAAQSVAEAGVTVGAMVYGPQGNEVGKVEKIDGEVVVVNTGAHSAALSGASFVKGPKGPVIGYTKAQLDDAIEGANQQAKAKLDAALVAGSALRTSDGVAVGTIKALNEDGSVVIEGTNQTFSLGRELFGTDDKGLILLITSQQLTEALSKSAPAAK